MLRFSPPPATTAAQPTAAHASDRRAVLAERLFIGCLVFNAVAVTVSLIIAIGDGPVGWKLASTALLITACAVLVAADAAAVDGSGAGPLPVTSAGLGLLAFGLGIVAVWTDDLGLDQGTFAKLVFVALTLAIAGTYASLLSLPDLEGDWVLARSAAYLGTGGIALLATIAIVAGSGLPTALYGILGAALVTATAAVAIGARATNRAAATDELIDLTDPAPNSELYTRVSHCPVCGAALAPEPAFGAAHDCGRCGTGFRIQITRRRTHF